jgi:hypothetical protein
VASGETQRRRGGGEDPWLYGPGFRRVCSCRWVVAPEIRRGTEGVKSGIVNPGRPCTVSYSATSLTVQVNQSRSSALRFQTILGGMGAQR